MCNPRRVEVTATRAIAEAWERAVRRAASRRGTVRGEVRIRQSLAASLGAQFWFDVLGKIVNLRMSGKRPEKAPSGR